MENKKVSAIIVDNESHAQEVLMQLLQNHCPEVEVMAVAEDIETAKKHILQFKPDVVFLDIDLGGDYSIDHLNELPTEPSKVVFTTGLSEHAIKAFEYHALHYLLKPIEVRELKEAVRRALSSAENNKSPKKQFNHQMRIALPDLYGYEFIQVKDIIRLEGDGAYTFIYTSSGEKKMATKPLGHFENELPEDLFFRIHKKHIINLNTIIRCSREKTPTVTLSNGDHLNVSRRARAQFFEELKKFTSF